MKKGDLIFAAVILIAAAALALFLRFTGKEGASVVVYTDGMETARYALSGHTETVLTGYTGGFNTLVIDHGRAYLTDADCPDRLCVGQGAIAKSGESIICLPHRIVVTVEGAGEPEVDMIAE